MNELDFLLRGLDEYAKTLDPWAQHCVVTVVNDASGKVRARLEKGEAAENELQEMKKAPKTG